LVVVRLGEGVLGVGFVGRVETDELCGLVVTIAGAGAGAGAGAEVDVGAAGWKLGAGAACCPQAVSARPSEAASNV
jgi:hypothetical protein